MVPFIGTADTSICRPRWEQPDRPTWPGEGGESQRATQGFCLGFCFGRLADREQQDLLNFLRSL